MSTSIITESKLNKSRTLKDLLTHYDVHFLKLDLHIYLNQLLEQKKMTKSQIYNRTQMGRTYVYQIFSNKRHPSRNKLLQIACAMSCSLDETQTLLMVSQHAPLCQHQKRDLIIAYCLHRKFDTFDLNACLYDHHEEPLFNEE